MDSELLQRYIAGRATDEEARRVVEWVEASPENLREYMSQRKLHDVALWRADAPSAIGQTKLGRRQVMRRLGWEMLKVAAVVALVFFGIRWWDAVRPGADTSAVRSVYVPAGQRAELMLADGTKVWLNSCSKLTFPSEFGGDARSVRLDGEGYFAVARNVEQPFIVETSKLNVRVLGTEFNVLAYATDSVWETSLLKGSVEIFEPGGDREAMRLEPDTKASLQGDHLVKGRIHETDYFLWREGLLCFHEISVGDMLEKLKLYYDVDIVVNNPQLFRNRYTGKFRTKDGVEHVLKVLKLNMAFNYTMDEEKNLITIY